MWWYPSYTSTTSQSQTIDEFISVSAVPGKVKIDFELDDKGSSTTLTLPLEMVDQFILRLTKAKEAAKVME